ncbi:MAG: hypothetical protein KDA42_16960 [Planctomycetales bacterium]|nr:hypothetical protein [Planctomycetales bacterium]
MKQILRLCSVLLCCVTFAACSGEDDDTAVADAGPALEPAVTEDAEGAGEEAMPEASDAADAMFNDTDDSSAADDTAEAPASDLFDNLQDTPTEESADDAVAEADAPQGDLFDALATEEPAADDTTAGAGVSDPLFGEESTADVSTDAVADDSGDIFDALATEEPAAETAADGGADEIADLTGDGPPTVEPVAESGGSLDDLLTGDETPAPAATDTAASGGSDLLDELDASQGGTDPILPPSETAEPDATAQEFLTAMRSGELATASRMIFEPTEPQWRDMVNKQVDKLHAEMSQGVTQIEVLEPRQQGNWVLVVCKVTTNRDGASRDRVSDQYFYLTDTGWKMMPETVRTDSAGQALVNADFDQLAQWYRDNKLSLEQKYLQP